MKPTTTRPLHAALHGGVHLALRSALPLLLATALVACSGDANDAAAPAPIGSLDTQAVAAGSEGGARAWDGVVEAVRVAALSAQTSGRVTEVVHDVNDRVDSGEVLVRLSAVEQQAGVDAARAQLKLAEATYQRMSRLAEGRYVSKMQLDQARADLARAVAVWRGPEGSQHLPGGLFVQAMILFDAGHGEHNPSPTEFLP